MPDTDPIFPHLHDPNLAERTIGDLKAAIGLSAKADQSSLEAETTARTLADSSLDSSKAPVSHTHVLADLPALAPALAGKADSGHTHTGLSVQAAGTPSVRSLGTGATDAAAGNDSRLSDARNPTAHTHAQADITGLAAVVTKVASMSGKRQETYSGTTNASGQFSATFATPFPVAPNIQANIINGADNQNIRLTSVTTTGFTVLVRNRVDVIGLLPSWNSAANMPVDVIVTEK